jgi:hypothetical protein
MPKKRYWWNPRLGPLSLFLFMGGLHAALGAVLAERDIVSSIFAAGQHVLSWMVILTGMFVATRLFVVLVAPGLLAWRLALSLSAGLEREKTPGAQDR